MEKPVNLYDYYTPINLNLWTDDQNFSALVEHIQEQSPKVGNPDIRKKHLTVVLANLYYTWLDDPEKYVGFYRMSNRYKARSMYNVLNISTLLIQIADDLLSLNYNHQEFIELLSNKHKPIGKYLYSGYGLIYSSSNNRYFYKEEYYYSLYP